jgi:murein DD-endopeptidase MepM/ murein hydrolase activator NlpD
MDEIRARLDRATARIEELRTREDELIRRIREIEAREAVLDGRNRRLEKLAAERADALYRDGATGMLEALFGADDFSELTSRAELMSALSRQDANVFGRLARTHLELRHLAGELGNRRTEIAQTREDIRSRAAALQREFEAVEAEYSKLQEKLARARARAEDAPSTPADQPEPSAVQAPVTDGMACPVAGPVSFIDSWGAPRDGHTHQGVDMMAGYGTPIVAIVSGNITYAAYDGSGGNMIFLSGNDGNAYWYMHNQENLVTGGHVQTGQQIATVGDTGNAEGTPHLHFEYHPGGGAAVDPYPLVASIC